MKAFFQLIRPINLLITVFTQYMVRFAFMYPAFKYVGFSLQLSEWLFAMFSLAFVLMAAGGYIINDYYDVEIDLVNRPERVMIGKSIKPQTAYALYWIVSLSGLVMGCVASYLIGLTELCFVFFIYQAGLWYYSTNLKYQFALGNLAIAFFLALVPFCAGLIELYADVRSPEFRHLNLNRAFVFYWIVGISLFAFVSSLAREIVKDMEDMDGDATQGCRTIPIVMGKVAARRIAQFLVIIMVSFLVYQQYQQIRAKDWESFIYFMCFIQLPAIFIIIKLNSANEPKEFHKISNWLKLLMVSGISYLFVFAYACLHQK